MRPLPTLLLIAAALLAAPSAVSAADTRVSVADDFFDAPTVHVQPGDSVIWDWTGSNKHNVKSFGDQTESFRSGILSGTGKTFSHTFGKPGRFTYYCEVHPDNMRGVVEVGTPPFPDTGVPRLTRLRAKTKKRTVKLSFRLSEQSRVKVSLSGPTRRSAAKPLGTGKRSVSFKRLRAGRYKATLRPTDSAGNRGKAVTKRFSVR